MSFEPPSLLRGWASHSVVRSQIAHILLRRPRPLGPLANMVVARTTSAVRRSRPAHSILGEREGKDITDEGLDQMSFICRPL